MGVTILWNSFGVEEHKNCIILHHTLYHVFLALMPNIAFAKDSDFKIAKDKQNSWTAKTPKIRY
jgi:hypothetical protein